MITRVGQGMTHPPPCADPTPALPPCLQVATARVKGAAKLEIPHVDDHVSKIDCVGLQVRGSGSGGGAQVACQLAARRVCQPHHPRSSCFSPLAHACCRLSSLLLLPQTQKKLEDIRAAAVAAGVPDLNLPINSVVKGPRCLAACCCATAGTELGRGPGAQIPSQQLLPAGVCMRSCMYLDPPGGPRADHPAPCCLPPLPARPLQWASSATWWRPPSATRRCARR